MQQQFTDSVTDALQAAFAEAQRRNQTEVTENHLLWAFLQDPQGYFHSILSNLETQPQALFREVEHTLEHLPTFSGGGAQPPAAARSLQGRIADAQNIAQRLERCVHKQRPFPCFLLEKWRRPFCHLEKTQALLKTTRRTNQKNSRRPPYGLSQRRIQCKHLEKYCKNLTALARKGKLDPVIGRDEEIRRTMQVLSRRTKNNPMLIGDPGVGKTAIAEGLAQRIIQEDVPDR